MKHLLFILTYILAGNIAPARDENYKSNDDNEKRTGPMVLIDAGADPIGAGLSTGWDYRYSMRIGVGDVAIRGDVHLRGFIEYQDYVIDNEFAVGVTYVREGTSVTRRDLAVYATAEYSYFAIGLGIAYIKSDNVTITDGSTYNERWEHGGLSRVSLYFVAGLKTEISLGGGFFLPVGLYFNPGNFGASRFITPRIGIAKQF